jgi:hypothetical protein
MPDSIERYALFCGLPDIKDFADFTDDKRFPQIKVDS